MQLLLLFVVIFLVSLKDGLCFFKIFHYDSHIMNPDLWVGHEKAKGCSGIIFTQDFHSVYIKQFKTAQMLLPPQHGSVYITEGGYLEINSDLVDTCIKIGEIPLHSYYNPTSWAPNNPAIPSIERIPCTHDEVMFPYALNTPVVFDDKIDLKMRHVIMDDTVIEEAYEFRKFLSSGQWPITAYAQPDVQFTKNVCEDESGCVCHEWREQNDVCRYIWGVSGGADGKSGGCMDAIEPPVGECGVSSFCGGVIHMKAHAQFKLSKLNQLLEEEFLTDDGTVMAYASKVAPNEHARLIQIVFAENFYTGQSAEAAASFFEKLTTSEMLREMQIFDVTLSTSGAPLLVGESAAGMVGMVFGTLFGVVVVFVAIYVCYVGPLKDYKFTKSLPSRSLTKTLTGVRYKRKDEEQLVYEGQSMAGSILSLDRAFDNPMYDAKTTTTVKRTKSSEKLHETNPNSLQVTQEQQQQQHEDNPMYNLPEIEDDLNKIVNIDSEI